MGELSKTEYSFADGFSGMPNEKKGAFKTFDWDKAAEIIKEMYKFHSDLEAEAGLQRDWANTSGVIFEEGKPIEDSYAYLSSNWAVPTLILSWGNREQEEIPCFIEGECRFNSSSKWDEQSLDILGIKLD